jgi:hypothetical protein
LKFDADQGTNILMFNEDREDGYYAFDLSEWFCPRDWEAFAEWEESLPEDPEEVKPPRPEHCGKEWDVQVLTSDE